MDSSVETLQLALEAIDLAPRLFVLWAVHPGRGAGQAPGGAGHDGRGDLQIAQQLGGRRVGDPRLHLLLRLQEQLRLLKNSRADLRCALAPGGIQLPSLSGGEPMPRQRRRHPPAIVQAEPRHRHQILHRHMRRDLPLAHLLLDGLRQHYKHIFLDSPPSTAVTDAVFLSKSVDGVVLILRSGDTVRDIARNGLAQLESVGAHIIGAVLNGVEIGGDGYYSYQYYYYYYGEDGEKKRKSSRKRKPKSAYGEEV